MNENLNNDTDLNQSPVVEKVSLKEIKAEKTAEGYAKFNEFLKEFSKLSPEEKEMLKNMLLNDDDEGE